MTGGGGVRRIKAQVLGVQSCEARGREAAKWQEIYSDPFGGQVARDREISRTQEFTG
jgi:hypothetical protein